MITVVEAIAQHARNTPGKTVLDELPVNATGKIDRARMLAEVTR